MKTVKQNGHTIEFFDSTKEIGFRRFHSFNKYYMIACSVGSTFDDYRARMAKAFQYLSKGMLNEGVEELENQYQCVYNSFTDYNPKHIAFAVLVSKIDGVECKYNSESELNNTLDKLESAGISEDQMHEIVDELKKKLNLN